MSGKYKVGDSVFVVGNFDGINFCNDIGIVSIIGSSTGNYGINFGENHRYFEKTLHNLHGKIHTNTGWFIPERMFKSANFDIGL